MRGFSIGFLLMMIVMTYVLKDSKVATFLNAHSLVLVVLGSVAVLILGTPGKDLRYLLSLFSMSFKSRLSAEEVKNLLLKLSKNPQSKDHSISHPLIILAQDLWEQGYDARNFRFIMGQWAQEQREKNTRAVLAIRNLSKYPPALGMTGTVIGLVSLFSDLSTNKQETMGLALALAMTATFYGLVLTNAVLMPLADRMHVWSLSVAEENERVLHCLYLVQEGQPDSIIEERFYSEHAA